MKRCADAACLDRYDGAALMSLESFALVGGALKGGRIVTVSGIRGVGQLSGPGRVLLVPEFFWVSVAVPVAEWMGVT